MRKNNAFDAKIVNTHLTKIFIAIFAPDQRLPSSATLVRWIHFWVFSTSNFAPMALSSDWKVFIFRHRHIIPHHRTSPHIIVHHRTSQRSVMPYWVGISWKAIIILIFVISSQPERVTGNYGEHDVDVDLGKSHFSFTQCSLKTTQTMPVLMKNEFWWRMSDLIMMVVKVTTMSYFAKKDSFKTRAKRLFFFTKILSFVCKQLNSCSRLLWKKI